MEVDVDVDYDESSESTGVRSSATASLFAPTPTSLRDAVMKEIPSSPVHSSAGTPGGSAMSTPPATSAGVNASGGTTRSGASVESPPVCF